MIDQAVVKNSYKKVLNKGAYILVVDNKSYKIDFPGELSFEIPGNYITRFVIRIKMERGSDHMVISPLFFIEHFRSLRSTL